MKDKAPILILHGSTQPYLSIGVHYGGVKAFGHEYLYMPNEDAFLRKDFVKKFNAQKKKGGTWNDFVEFVKTKSNEKTNP